MSGSPGSVVIDNIPDNVIAVGNPTKVMKREGNFSNFSSS